MKDEEMRGKERGEETRGKGEESIAEGGRKRIVEDSKGGNMKQGET